MTDQNAPAATARPQGLILFAHGARDSRWAAPFEAVASRLRGARPGLRVRLAYLELMSPSLPEAAEQLCGEGCVRIDVLPMFLGAGGHLRNDLPPMMLRLRQAHPGVEWVLHGAVGELDGVVRAMAEAALQLAEAAAPGTHA
jgi:sirohydrochlorin cobaltochelatase